ncbi:hypothetical protein AWENTII_000931 [Aspergillus wentii]|nr:hypothetical protein MW887_002055 [Aspergillus wentii]
MESLDEQGHWHGEDPFRGELPDALESGVVDDEGSNSLVEEIRELPDEGLDDWFQEKRESFIKELDGLGDTSSDNERLQVVNAYRPFFDDTFDSLVGLSTKTWLLYFASNSKSQTPKPWEPWLVKHLSSEFPHLLQESDPGRSEWALKKAVTKKLVWFVDSVLESQISDEDLQKALGPPEGSNTRTSNCIHAAIQNNLVKSITLRLIERASEPILSALNEQDLTPLHIAVEYSRCTPAQVPIVDALIKHGNSAFDTPDCRSVYQYHYYTRDNYSKSPPEQKPGVGRFLSLQNKKLARLMPPKSTKHGDTSAFQGGIDEKKRREDPSPKPYDGTEPIDKRQRELKQEAERMRTREPIPGGLKRAPTNRADIQSPSRDPRGADRKPPLANQSRTVSVPDNIKFREKEDTYAKGVAAQPSKPTQYPGRPPPPPCADEIAEKLKLYYLRTTIRSTGKPNTSTYKKAGEVRTYNSAERFLYGENNEHKKLCFDFPARPLGQDEKINFDNFRTAYQHTSFDPVLLYVKFGQLEVELPDPGPRGAKSRTRATGKKDLQYLLEWLADEKKVKKIIKLIADDRKDLPHRDETIIESLRKFDIEILDWQKTDICPSVIQQASREWTNLHEIHLQWSGSNTALRAWSEPNGLPAIKSLDRVVLNEANEPLDTDGYVNRRINEFKSRLNENRSDADKGLRHIDVHVERHRSNSSHSSRPDPWSAGNGSRGKNSNTRNEHLWLETMTRFVNNIQELNREGHDRFGAEFPRTYDRQADVPKELTKDITVALIDDGVDFMCTPIIQNLLDGRSFPSGFSDNDVLGAPEPPYHGSTTGHGTDMAKHIARLCPWVKIFVCRLDMLGGGNSGKMNFTAKSAADAVEYVARQGYDIISLSWTIVKEVSKKENSNVHDLNRLTTALNDAAGRNTLIFCSAPDVGETDEQDKWYPFDCSSVLNMFRIGAAHKDGTKQGMAGNRVDFILPGVDVFLKESHRSMPGADDRPRTGSSIATALAAGLAALMIHCVKMAAILNFLNGTSNGRVNADTLKAIKRFHVMKQAFQGSERQGNPSNNDKKVSVKSFSMQPSHNAPSDSSSGLKWDDMEKVARELVSYGMEEKALKD